MKTIQLFITIIISNICFSQGLWTDVGTPGYFGYTVQQDMTVLDNGTPIVAYVDAESLGDLNILSWNGNSWTNMPAISSSMVTNATNLSDIKVVHINNTPYIGVGNNGSSYEVYKFLSKERIVKADVVKRFVTCNKMSYIGSFAQFLRVM